MSKSICDGCGKERHVEACGRDANGEPDAPDLCFICRKEAEKGRDYDKKLGRYVYLSDFYVEPSAEELAQAAREAEEDEKSNEAFWAGALSC